MLINLLFSYIELQKCAFGVMLVEDDTKHLGCRHIFSLLIQNKCTDRTLITSLHLPTKVPYLQTVSYIQIMS